MISIGRIFGHDQKFYDLLEASAQQADTSVHHLVDLLAKIDNKSSAPNQTAEAVLAMVKQLRKGMNVGTAREMNAKLQNIEGEADNLELELLRDLYQGNYEPKHVIFLRDLYDLLEKVIDRCRDAGNVILQIVLKNT